MTPPNKGNAMKTMEQEYGGKVWACGHLACFSYWDFVSELTDELKAELDEHAEQRIRECVALDCVSGELNFLNTLNDEEIRGWWKLAPNPES